MQALIQQPHALGLQLTVVLTPTQNLTFYSCVTSTVILSLASRYPYLTQELQITPLTTSYSNYWMFSITSSKN